MPQNRDETRIYNKNKFKLGLFGMNCSGRLEPDQGAGALGCLVGQQRQGGEARRRGRPRVPAADRAMARLPGRERHPGHDLRDLDLGLRAARLDPRDHDVRHAPRRVRQSGLCRQADGDGRSHRPRSLRPQRRFRLEPDRVRHDGRRARRSRRPLRLRRGMARRSSIASGPSTSRSTSTVIITS